MVGEALGAIALIILKGLAWAYTVLPGSARVALGHLVGAGLRLAGFRSQVVRGNLMIAYPGESDERREQLFRSAYAHLGRLVLEILMLFGPMRWYVRRYTRFDGIERWQAAKAQGRGVLFLASHLGNWEIMSASGALAGIDIMIVTKHLKPEWLHRAIERGRAACGVLGTYEPKTLRDVLKHLNEKKTVGFVLDQYAGPPIGVRVPFFGVPVGTANIVATLAKRTGAPVLPAISYRTPEGGYRVAIGPALEWISDPDPHQELALNTALYVSTLEGYIRTCPEQWLWTHRRFKGDLAPLRPSEWQEGRARS